MSGDGYDFGDPKGSDYRGGSICVWCTGVGGHYSGCPEATS